jgi:hypothetical protein
MYYLIYLFYLSFHRIKTDQLKETALQHTLLTKQISHMYSQSQTSGLINMTGKYMCVHVYIQYVHMCVMGMWLMQSC